MSNDYPDSYKPVEGVPPRKRGLYENNPSIDDMAKTLSPAAARRVIDFMETHQNYKQMPEHIMAQLLEKANQELEPEAAKPGPTEATAEREQTAKAVEGSSQSNPPTVFPDGSKLDADENGQPYPF